VTRLPPNPASLTVVDVNSVRFLPDGRIFVGLAGQTLQGFTVRPDGTDLKMISLPVPLPGGHIDPNFEITGDEVTAYRIDVPGGISEIFLSDRGDFLQLTNFGRADTRRGTVDIDGQRVFFLASAD